MWGELILNKQIATKNAEGSEDNNIEDYLMKLQNSIRNITTEDSSGNASPQKSQAIDTAPSKKIRKTSNRTERVSRERIRHQEKPESWVIKKEEDGLEAESKEKDNLQSAQARLSRLERWQSLAAGNRRTQLRQRLLNKAISEQEREIEQLEKGEKTTGRLRKQRRKTFAAKLSENVGRMIKR